MPAARHTKLLRSTVIHGFVAGRDESLDVEPGFGPDVGTTRASIPPPPPMELPELGDVVGDHYKLVSVLGQGMFGKVYVAERVDVPEHRVALKLMPRSLYVGRNIERELVMLATVGHPNVVQLKDHGMTPDYVWLTMPVYQGETLAERLERGTLSLREAYDIFLPIARGLEALHMAGLRHQDVKPDNLFLAVFGGRLHPVLLDLGVAAERDATFVAGTALFGAPEQVSVLSGMPIVAPLTEKMDTYGLAATLLTSIVGPRYFPGENADSRSELADAHEARQSYPLVEDALPSLTGAPRELIARSFSKWLSYDPDERPSMGELCDHLEVLLEPEREAAREEERKRQKQRATIQRFKVVFGAMILIGLGVAGVAFSKREALQMAAALDAAKRQGAEGFDRLDTCIAAGQLTRADLDSCREGAARDKAEFTQSLDKVMKSGSGTEAERARDLAALTGKLRTCEESSAIARRTCEEASTREFAENARARAALGLERDEARRSLESARLDATAAVAERDACRIERAACVEERDGLRTTSRGGSRPVAGGGVPLPAPTAPVAATGSPVAPPPPAAPPPANIPDLAAPPPVATP